ncbi:MAG: glycosyltransferase, partial [Patescibacteria group bacterium]|nr:glycosyltransferase [Patescibacteria group bacterium]
MKILIVITKGNTGGAQMSALNLADGLKNNGHDVTVGFGYGDFLPKELNKINIPFVNFKNLKRSHNPLANLFFIWEIKKYLDKNKYDVIHINSSNALAAALAAKLSRTKLRTIFTHRGLTLLDANYQKNKFLKLIYKFYFKFFLRYIDEQIFVSQNNFDYALKNKIAKNGFVIHNGLDPVNLKIYPKDAAREKLLLINNSAFRIPHSAFALGSIGRLDYAKNYEFLINLFPEILRIKPNAKFIIIGEGAERKNYKAMIKRLNLQNKIILAGEIKNASQYIKAFDLFVLPSRYEGLSITLIEALFAGVPILASNVGGTPELLEHAKEQLFELDNTA